MRKCKLILTKTDGTEHILYTGSQRTHMSNLLDSMLKRGELVRIECNPPEKRRVRINPLLQGKIDYPLGHHRWRR